MRRGEKDLAWKRMMREIKDEKSKRGSRLMEDWKRNWESTRFEDGATRPRIVAG